jgi:hypothetical protein
MGPPDCCDAESFHADARRNINNGAIGLYGKLKQKKIEIYVGYLIYTGAQHGITAA